MTTAVDHAPAKIFEFPRRGRFAIAEPPPGSEADRMPVALGDAWYHDEAIKAERPRKD
jgi:hypothetical protein